MIKSGKLCQIATQTSVFEIGILLKFLRLPITRVKVISRSWDGIKSLGRS